MNHNFAQSAATQIGEVHATFWQRALFAVLEGVFVANVADNGEALVMDIFSEMGDKTSLLDAAQLLGEAKDMPSILPYYNGRPGIIDDECPFNETTGVAGMEDSVLNNLRMGYIAVARQAAVKGWTNAETNRALQEDWHRRSGNNNLYRFVDRSGRAWENAQYFQMQVRTNASRVWQVVPLAVGERRADDALAALVHDDLRLQRVPLLLAGVMPALFLLGRCTGLSVASARTASMPASPLSSSFLPGRENAPSLTGMSSARRMAV